jgi:hypothetical protein
MKNTVLEFQFSKRNILLFILATSLVVMLLGGCIGDRESMIPKIPSTSLVNESIDEIKLLDSIHSVDFVEKYGKELETIPNSKYNYYNLKNKLVIATNKKGEIVRISTPSKDASFQTSKGISISSTRDEIIKIYGKNQYERSDELGYKVLGYIDNQNKRTIEFFFTEQEGILDHINLDLLEVN